MCVAAAGCMSGGDYDMTLRGEGYIKVSGGCVALATGEMRFMPKADGSVRVVVNNRGGWFRVGSGPFHGCDVSISSDEAWTFFAVVKDMLDYPREAEHGPSTRMAVVEIYLPLKSGDIETTWREADGKYDLDPLLDYLQESVESFAVK
jgi:hypothetical protein